MKRIVSSSSQRIREIIVLAVKEEMKLDFFRRLIKCRSTFCTMKKTKREESKRRGVGDKSIS